MFLYDNTGKDEIATVLTSTLYQLFLRTIFWDMVIAPICEYRYGPREKWENNNTTKAIRILSLSAIHSLIGFTAIRYNSNNKNPYDLIKKAIPFILIRHATYEYLGFLGGSATIAGMYLGPGMIAKIFGRSFQAIVDSGITNNEC